MGNAKVLASFDEERKCYQIFIEMKEIGLSIGRFESVVTYRSWQEGLLRPNNPDNPQHDRKQIGILCTRHFCIETGRAYTGLV